MVSWYRLPPGREEIQSAADGINCEASPICPGANGRMASMLNATSHAVPGGGNSDSIFFVHALGRRSESRGGRSHNVDFHDGLSWYV